MCSKQKAVSPIECANVWENQIWKMKRIVNQMMFSFSLIELNREWENFNKKEHLDRAAAAAAAFGPNHSLTIRNTSFNIQHNLNTFDGSQTNRLFEGIFPISENIALIIMINIFIHRIWFQLILSSSFKLIRQNICTTYISHWNCIEFDIVLNNKKKFTLVSHFKCDEF